MEKLENIPRIKWRSQQMTGSEEICLSISYADLRGKWTQPINWDFILNQF